MANKVTLLQLSPTMTDGTIVKWLVKEGDPVKSGKPIAEIETDKAVMEQESFEDGVVLKLLVAEGARVPVGSIIMVSGNKGEDISAILAEGSAPAAAPAAKAPAAKPAEVKAPAAAPAAKPAVPAPAAAPAPVAAKAANGNGGSRVFASPLARKIAGEAGLDLQSIAGSGPSGRVVKSDVELALSRPAAVASSAPLVPAAGARRINLSGMRQTIAKRLSQSKQTVPHFQLTIEVRGEKLLAAAARIKELHPDAKVTVTHFLIKAMAMVSMRHEAVRSQWGGDHVQVIDAAHISVAVAIAEGLVTPVIRDAHTKGVIKIAEELRDLAGKARERKLTAEDMSGGTQTISNLGMFGIHDFTAIINIPEASILAVGGMEDRAVVDNGQVVPGKVMKITMSLDHRVIDGAVGAAYLADLKKALEEPLLMLL